MKTAPLNEAIKTLLTAKLKRFYCCAINRTTCFEIYNEIFDTTMQVFMGAQVKISNEAMNYMAQQYYDLVTINGSHELDPDIFTQRASIDNIPTNELVLLALTFSGTDMAVPLIDAIKRRS